MAKYVNNPNPYSKTLNKRYTHYFFVLLSAMAGIALAYWLSTITNLLVAMLGYLMVVVFVLVSGRIVKQMGKNDRGAMGERHVKKILDQLSDKYTVFQNVPIKNHLDIDFVLVGPIGVLAIEVKSHKGYNVFLKNKFISQTFAEMMGLKESLKHAGVDLYLQGALVFTGAFVKYYPPSKGVHVINKDYLLTLIDRSKKIKFDQAKTETIINNLYLTSFKD